MSGRPDAARGDTAEPGVRGDRLGRALAIGFGWALLVVALLLLASAGRSFIYQGF